MNRLTILPHLSIPLDELELSAVASQGPGGQNVNKVASAIQLRFDIRASSLPPEIKETILACRDRRISHDGVLILKAQRYRSQEMNRADALQRLAELLARVATPVVPRKPTRPTRSSREARITEKKGRGQVKSLRRKPVSTRNDDG